METLEYATPERVPPPDGLRKTSVWLSGVSSTVGLLVLAGFAVTRLQGIAFVGFLWLYPGALMTLIAFVCGTTYAVTAWQGGFPPPSTQRKAIVAVLLPCATLAVAIACIVLGILLLDLFYPSVDGL